MRNAITGHVSELRNKSKTPKVEKTEVKVKLGKDDREDSSDECDKERKNATRATRRANPERNPSAPTVNDFFCLNRNC